MDTQPLDITVRVGCRQTYDASKPTTTLVIVKPHHNQTQEVTQERFIVTPEKTGEGFQNENGNTVYRFVFPFGATTICGHTHRESTYSPLPNVCVRVAGAIYYDFRPAGQIEV